MAASALRLETINPFSNFFNSVNRHFQKIGYIRAARELTRAGYPDEARNCIKMMNEL